jgi:hypothetical protein
MQQVRNNIVQRIRNIPYEIQGLLLVAEEGLKFWANELICKEETKKKKKKKRQVSFPPKKVIQGENEPSTNSIRHNSSAQSTSQENAS